MIRRVLGLGAATCLLAGTTAGGASAAVAPGARATVASSIWQVVPSANPQPHLVTDSEFASVSMGSATDGWTVGSFLAANAAYPTFDIFGYAHIPAKEQDWYGG